MTGSPDVGLAATPPPGPPQLYLMPVMTTDDEEAATWSLTSDSRNDDFSSLTGTLNLSSLGITNLTGLEYLTEIEIFRKREKEGELEYLFE